MIKENTILVIGGAGFIGSSLVEHLLNGGNNVIVVDNFFLGNMQNLKRVSDNSRLSIFRIDARDESTLTRLALDFEAQFIFNLGVSPLPASLHSPAWTFRNNVEIGIACCEVVRKHREIKLINVSSSEVYGTSKETPMTENHPRNPLTPYAASKNSVDDIVSTYHRTFDIEAVTICPFNNYGPRQNQMEYAGLIPSLWRAFKEKRPLRIFGNGENSRDYVFVEDTARALALCLDFESWDNPRINLATGKSTSVNEVVQAFFRVLELENYPVVYADERAGDVTQHLGSFEKALDIFNFKPREFCDELLSLTLDYYAKSGSNYVA